MLQLLVAQRFSIVNSSAIQSVTAKLCIEIITKHILHYGKMFLRMSSLSHVRFVNLPGCDELVRFYWQQVVMSANAPGDLTRGSVLHLLSPDSSDIFPRLTCGNLPCATYCPSHGFIPRQPTTANSRT